MGQYVTFSGIKENIFDSSTLVYICLPRLVTCLHSSTFVYWLVYTRLVTRLQSSTFVYIRLWLVYIRLHSSTLVQLLVCVFRTDP